jgi:hypothetical protein
MRIRRTLTALAATLVLGTPLWAGPYGDELSKCLVESTTTEDKSTLVQWMFAMSALHPDVKQLSAVSAGKRNDLNKQFAGLLTTLLTKSCVDESKAAIKYEGPETISQGFSVLGQVAGRELFSNAEVAAGMGELEGLVDDKKIETALGLKK